MPGKSRVLASSAVVRISDALLGVEVSIGEVDSFTATSTSSLGKSRPIGAAIETPYVRYGGWEFTMKGGKIDWKLAQTIHAQDILARTAGIHPTFNIYQTIKYYDGKEETYVYNNAVIYAYDIDMQTGQEITEGIKGFAPERNHSDIGGDVLGIVEQVASAIAAQLAEKIKNGIGEELGLF